MASRNAVREKNPVVCAIDIRQHKLCSCVQANRHFFQRSASACAFTTTKISSPSQGNLPGLTGGRHKLNDVIYCAIRFLERTPGNRTEVRLILSLDTHVPIWRDRKDSNLRPFC